MRFVAALLLALLPSIVSARDSGQWDAEDPAIAQWYAGLRQPDIQEERRFEAALHAKREEMAEASQKERGLEVQIRKLAAHQQVLAGFNIPSVPRKRLTPTGGPEAQGRGASRLVFEKQSGKTARLCISFRKLRQHIQEAAGEALRQDEADKTRLVWRYVGLTS